MGYIRLCGWQSGEHPPRLIEHSSPSWPSGPRESSLRSVVLRRIDLFTQSSFGDLIRRRTLNLKAQAVSELISMPHGTSREHYLLRNLNSFILSHQDSYPPRASIQHTLLDGRFGRAGVDEDHDVGIRVVVKCVPW